MRITSIEPQKKTPYTAEHLRRREIRPGHQRRNPLAVRSTSRRRPPSRSHDGPRKCRGAGRGKRSRPSFPYRASATEREIRDKLREKEFGDEEIAQTITALKNAGLLDDAAFARMYIRDALAGRPAGKMLLKKKLLLLGVDKSVADEAIEETFAGVDVQATALALARQFIKKTQNLKKDETPMKARNRVSTFLARKGYGWDVIAAVLKEIFTADEETEG